MGYKLHTDIPVQMTRHSKQNSCEQRGISVRSVSRCKQMLHWSSTSSFSSFSTERSPSERDSSGGGDSRSMRFAEGGESCMRSHTTVAGWVMGLLDHFGITRTAAPAAAYPATFGVCVYFESMLLPEILASKESWFKHARQQPECFCSAERLFPDPRITIADCG